MSQDLRFSKRLIPWIHICRGGSIQGPAKFLSCLISQSELALSVWYVPWQKVLFCTRYLHDQGPNHCFCKPPVYFTMLRLHRHLIQCWCCTFDSANEYVSSLPLQMSLYFNAFFFPCWWIVMVVMLEAKVRFWDTSADRGVKLMILTWKCEIWNQRKIHTQE